MCGIVGDIGKRQAAPILMAGLNRLEYRGDDRPASPSPTKARSRSPSARAACANWMS